MQTQGISLNLSALQSMPSAKTTKVSESTFDSFMSRNAQGASAKQQEVKSKDNGSDIRSSSDEFNRNKISLTTGNQKKEQWVEAVDVEKISSEVVSFLEQTFGLSEEDILDILEQLGITPAELVFFVSPDSQAVLPVNVDNIKALIMEVHGVDDANLFLTSDLLSGELSDVMSGIQDILNTELGMDAQSLSQGDSVLLQSFAEKFAEIVNQSEEVVADAKPKESVPDTVPDMQSAAGEDEIPVVVELSGDSGLSESSADSSHAATQGLSQADGESPLNTFVERLSQSFESVRQEQGTAVRTTMTNIVEQVVNHIRIRVLPQTTSMELQLNPESLGRVNLHVTSDNGTATATLTVQNQVAKEALESQITVLRENLEEHGLKVDAVEVNVSEFAFKKQEDSGNEQHSQKKASKRRFRVEAGNSAVEEAVETEAAEQAATDSVVDYTA